MCGDHGGPTIHAELKRDPTRTKTLRNQFSAEMYKRFRELKGAIRRELVEQDGFGLRTNTALVAHRGRFEFTRDDEKVDAFMGWLQEQQRAGILGVQRGASARQAASQSWMNAYIETAYQKGVVHAAGEMRSAGADVAPRWINAAFSRPIHADRAGLAYTRAYNELRGITEAMDQQISRELAQGLAQGKNPREIARRLTDRVDKIGLTRARMLAQTEVINAHAEASLNAYEEAGIEGVDVLAEFATAGDDRVCPTCEALENEVRADGGWTLQRARGVIPVHPRCRCAWLPKVPPAGRRIELL